MKISWGCEIGLHRGCDPTLHGCGCKHHSQRHPRLARPLLPAGFQVKPVTREPEDALSEQLRRMREAR